MDNRTLQDIIKSIPNMTDEERTELETRILSKTQTSIIYPHGAPDPRNMENIKVEVEDTRGLIDR